MYNDPNQSPYGQPQQSQQPQSPYNQPPTQYPGLPGSSNPYEMPPSNPYEMPPTQYAGPSPYNVPPAPVPGFAQPQLQPKRSLRWLWITLGIIGGVLLLSCAGCFIAGAAGYNFFAQTVIGPTTVANSYYSAIQNQDYAKAYSYLDSNMQTLSGQTLTQNLYTTAATAKDTADGAVISFSQTDYTTNNGTASITMSVTRNGLTYDVHLQLQQANNNWVITSYDAI